jgi:hypothetical protein
VSVVAMGVCTYLHYSTYVRDWRTDR